MSGPCTCDANSVRYEDFIRDLGASYMQSGPYRQRGRTLFLSEGREYEIEEGEKSDEQEKNEYRTKENELNSGFPLKKEGRIEVTKLFSINRIHEFSNYSSRLDEATTELVYASAGFIFTLMAEGIALTDTQIGKIVACFNAAKSICNSYLELKNKIDTLLAIEKDKLVPLKVYQKQSLIKTFIIEKMIVREIRFVPYNYPVDNFSVPLQTDMKRVIRVDVQNVSCEPNEHIVLEHTLPTFSMSTFSYNRIDTQRMLKLAEKATTPSFDTRYDTIDNVIPEIIKMDKLVAAINDGIKRLASLQSPQATSVSNTNSVKQDDNKWYGWYTVKQDDNLSLIAQRELGSRASGWDVYEWNKAIIDERNNGKSVPKETIYPGQRLYLR